MAVSIDSADTAAWPTLYCQLARVRARLDCSRSHAMARAAVHMCSWPKVKTRAATQHPMCRGPSARRRSTRAPIWDWSKRTPCPWCIPRKPRRACRPPADHALGSRRASGSRRAPSIRVPPRGWSARLGGVPAGAGAAPRRRLPAPQAARAAECPWPSLHLATTTRTPRSVCALPRGRCCPAQPRLPVTSGYRVCTRSGTRGGYARVCTAPGARAHRTAGAGAAPRRRLPAPDYFTLSAVVCAPTPPTPSSPRCCDK